MIPFDPKVFTLVAGPAASGKTNALCRMAIAGPPGTWLTSYDMHDVYLRRRMRAASCGNIVFAYGIGSMVDAIHDSAPPLVVIDGADHNCDPRRTGFEHIEALIAACKAVRAGLVLSVSSPRVAPHRPPVAVAKLAEHLWIVDKLQMKCVRGPYEGQNVTLPPVVF